MVVTGRSPSLCDLTSLSLFPILQVEATPSILLSLALLCGLT